MKLFTTFIFSLLASLQAARGIGLKKRITGPLTTTVGSSADVTPFWVLQCNGAPVVTERLDPIVSPGLVSGHTHSVWGGNAFGDTLTYADTQTSTCNTCQVMSDHSNYWMPTVYFRDPDNGTFEVVPNGQAMKIYYVCDSRFTSTFLPRPFADNLQRPRKP